MTTKTARRASSPATPLPAATLRRLREASLRFRLAVVHMDRAWPGQPVWPFTLDRSTAAWKRFAAATPKAPWEISIKGKSEEANVARFHKALPGWHKASGDMIALIRSLSTPESPCFAVEVDGFLYALSHSEDGNGKPDEEGWAIEAIDVSSIRGYGSSLTCRAAEKA